MEKYQENPQLLDPILQDIIAPLAQALQQASLDATAGGSSAKAKQNLINHLSQILWVIASVRWSSTLLLTPPGSGAYPWFLLSLGRQLPKCTQS